MHNYCKTGINFLLLLSKNTYMFLMDKAIEDFKKSEMDKKQIKLCLHNAIIHEDIINIKRYYGMLEEIKLSMINLADMIEYNQSLN